MADKKGIICALAEVIWVGGTDEEGMVESGLRFLNILEEDQNRIDTVVQALLKRIEAAGG